MSAFRPVTDQSATATANRVMNRIPQRRQSTESTRAIAIHTRPSRPAQESPSKTGLSQPVRWWTIQRSR